MHISRDVEAQLLRLSHSLHNLAKFLDGDDYESKVVPNVKLYGKSFRDSQFHSVGLLLDRLDTGELTVVEVEALTVVTGELTVVEVEALTVATYPLGFLPAPTYLSAVDCMATIVSPPYEPQDPNTERPTTGNLPYVYHAKVLINAKAGIIKVQDFHPPAPGIYFMILRESRTVLHLFVLTRKDVERGVVRFSNKIKAGIALPIFKGVSVLQCVGDNLFEPYEFKFGPKPETVETPVQLLYRPSSNMVFQI